MQAERALLGLVEGGCQVPFGAWSRDEEGELELRAVLAENGTLYRAEARGVDPQPLAEEVWKLLGRSEGRG